MGVRGLQTFLEKYCPEACHKVDIEKLAQEYKNKTGQDAKIVVDAQSCYTLWYKDLHWMIGFEIQELVNRLQDFVAAFKKLNIQLIFFFGGLTPEKKREAWIRRRRKNIDDYCTMFDCLKDGSDVVEPPSFANIPPNMGITSQYILKYVLNCQVHLTVDECDEEIVDYVNKHKCFAVFGQDTDFVVSQLNDAFILSSKNFSVKTMTTLTYDPVKLAHHLRISRDQLPFLALLAGSDLVPFDKLKTFHRRLCNITTPTGMIPYQELMPALGEYINDLPKNVPLERIFKQIATDVFEDSFSSELLEMIYTSYFIRKTSPEVLPEDEWLRILYVARYRHRMTKAPTWVYSIMSGRTFEWSAVFEDLRVVNDLNSRTRNQASSTVTRPLRLRLYGILLHEKSGPVTVEEWCADNCRGFSKPIVVDPIKPIVHHPGLIELWSDSNNDYINDKRWALFLTSIDPSLKQAKLETFDDDFFSSLTLYYLYRIKFLNDAELDAVLATIATYRLYRQYRARSLHYTLNLRATHISVTFLRTYGLILTLLAACGYPVALTPETAIPKFEGKLFQLKYAEVMENSRAYRRDGLCENDKVVMDIFYRMRRFIRPETVITRSNNRGNKKVHHVQRFM